MKYRVITAQEREERGMGRGMRKPNINHMPDPNRYQGQLEDTGDTFEERKQSFDNNRNESPEQDRNDSYNH